MKISQLGVIHTTIADVTGGKPIAVLFKSISGVSAINPLVAFSDIHGRKREMLFFYFVPETTRDYGETIVTTIPYTRRITTCHVCSIRHS
jgi:hypothetical protein